MRGRPWEYVFYVDFLRGDDEPAKNALRHLERGSRVRQSAGNLQGSITAISRSAAVPAAVQRASRPPTPRERRSRRFHLERLHHIGPVFCIRNLETSSALAAALLIQCEPSARGIEFILRNPPGNREPFPESYHLKLE